MLDGVSIKPGVQLSGIRPEIVLAIVVARSLFFRVKVTSVADVHTGRVSGSLHNVGLGVDLVVPGVPASRVAEKLRANLGPEFDVIPEPDHVHVEFQPD